MKTEIATEPNRQFETPDLYLSAALVILIKETPGIRVKNNRALFSFPVSDELHQATTDFYRGASVPAITYAEMIRRLKAEMWQCKARGAGI